MRELIRRFTDDRIAAVGGWVDVRNKHDNWLTRMQVVKYWYAYFFLKNLEWGFRRVMCLSGCLTAYRRAVLIELEPVLEDRSILGVPIKYGEDRFLTRQIVKAGYLTTMTLDGALPHVRADHAAGYFSQQLRWRRSNIVDYVGGVQPRVAAEPGPRDPLLLAVRAAARLSDRGRPRARVAQVLPGARAPHRGRRACSASTTAGASRKLPPEERVGALAFMPLRC